MKLPKQILPVLMCLFFGHDITAQPITFTGLQQLASDKNNFDNAKGILTPFNFLFVENINNEEFDGFLFKSVDTICDCKEYNKANYCTGLVSCYKSKKEGYSCAQYSTVCRLNYDKLLKEMEKGFVLDSTMEGSEGYFKHTYSSTKNSEYKITAEQTKQDTGTISQYVITVFCYPQNAATVDAKFLLYDFSLLKSRDKADISAGKQGFSFVQSHTIGGTRNMYYDSKNENYFFVEGKIYKKENAISLNVAVDNSYSIANFTTHSKAQFTALLNSFVSGYGFKKSPAGKYTEYGHSVTDYTSPSNLTGYKLQVKEFKDDSFKGATIYGISVKHTR